VERLFFKDRWERFFAEFGLTKFDDFFGFSAGDEINRNRKRNVYRLTFGDSDSQVFFIKRFFKPYLKDMFFACCNFGWGCSQAANEWHNAELLLNNGIETYHPVCFGERLRCGMETRSFLITRQIQGQCLSEFVARHWQQISDEKKKQIVVLLADGIRKMHDAGIDMPDLHIHHIFLIEAESRLCDIGMIDLHRMKHNCRGEGFKVRDLARIHCSMLEKYFTTAQKRLLIEAYAKGNWQGGINRLIAKVERLSGSMTARKKQKEY